MKNSVISFFILFAFFGCQNAKPEKFVGKWKLLDKDIKDTIKISIRDGNLLVEYGDDIVPGYFSKNCFVANYSFGVCEYCLQGMGDTTLFAQYTNSKQQLVFTKIK